jgi:hypothetical protein
MKTSSASNKMRFASCARGGALLKTLAKRAAAGGLVLFSGVCPVFERFQNHQPRAGAQWPMNKLILKRSEVFRGKTARRATQTNLNERTQSAPN